MVFYFCHVGEKFEFVHIPNGRWTVWDFGDFTKMLLTVLLKLPAAPQTRRSGGRAGGRGLHFLVHLTNTNWIFVWGLQALEIIPSF